MTMKTTCPSDKPMFGKDVESSPTTVATTLTNAAAASADSKIIPPISLPKSALVGEERGNSKWKVPLPASSKANRTTNPIRAIVDPIVRNIQTGEQRGDGKDHISLAVR